MPELPEVETLVRHLAPLLRNKTIRGMTVRRPKYLAPTTEPEMKRALRGAKFTGLVRRGKYLLFFLARPGKREPLQLIGHLGMTGRIYLQEKNSTLPKHAAVVLDLGRYNLVFEDARYFGRLTLAADGLEKLGPEPAGKDFTVKYFAAALARSTQPIKVKLLDQSLVAGVGNIYASEALFRAGISPRVAAKKLNLEQVGRLRLAIREVLAAAVRLGSTVPLDYAGKAGRDRLFYYGSGKDAERFYEERLWVYDRAGQPCRKCGGEIKRIEQAARSTYYCGVCQPG